jgi:hypothetical protein
LSEEIVNLLASKFIARPDVRAIQFITSDGKAMYMPDGVRDRSGKYTSYHPWDRAALTAHVEGTKSFGHYLLSSESKCKLFAFDIDLEEEGFLPNAPWPGTNQEGADPWASHEEIEAWANAFIPANPREAWTDRAHVGRSWMKYQLKMVASQLQKVIHDELRIHTAVAYSGGKGVHVYGFTGLVDAADAREAAQIVLDTMEVWEPKRGHHFFRHKNTDPIEGFPNLSVEVFPKQISLDGKDLGNLMRLPLGRNLKSPDPTFFIDMTSPMVEMRPLDAVHALTENPWVTVNG